MAQQGGFQNANGMGGPAGPGGPLGQTPLPSPAPSPSQAVPPGQQPSGLSPIAKRPLDRSAHVAMETNGPQRVMSIEDITQGFYNIIGKQEVTEKWVYDVAGVVRENAELLNAVINRVNVAESNTALIQKQVNDLTADTRGMLEKVDDKHVARDTTLRNELDQMATRLEQGHAELKGMIAAAAATQPAHPPGIGMAAAAEESV